MLNVRSMRVLLQVLNMAEQKAILGTHQVNITALTGVFPTHDEAQE